MPGSWIHWAHPLMSEAALKSEYRPKIRSRIPLWRLQISLEAFPISKGHQAVHAILAEIWRNYLVTL